MACDRFQCQWGPAAGDVRECVKCGAKQRRCRSCCGEVWKKIPAAESPAAPIVDTPPTGTREFWPGVADPLPDLNAILPRDRFWVPVSDWTWHTRHVVKNSHRAALDQLAESPLPILQGDGDGIVYVGGDSASGPYGLGVALGLRHARDVGYDGPIEWWYDSRRERIDPRYLEGMGDVRVRDLRTVSPQPITYRGWHAKPVAIAHSQFCRVLMLDSDAVLVNNPAELFKTLGDNPFLYWEKHDMRTPWSRVSAKLKGRLSNVGVQGGQLLVDRPAASRLLLLALWMNSHADYYDPRATVPRGLNYGGMFGEEDIWTCAREMARLHGEPHVGRSLGVGRVGTFVTVEYFLGDDIYVKHYAGHKPTFAWTPAGDARDDFKSVTFAHQLTGPTVPPFFWKSRPDTHDARIFQDVASNNEYRFPAELPPGSIVLDLGAHIGSFAWLAYLRGAKVISVEPDAANLRYLESNTSRFRDAVEIRRGAVVQDATGDTVRITPHKSPAETWASVTEGDGVEVPAIRFDSLLSEFPAVEFLKMDIEGAELSILTGSNELRRVRRIAAEIHCQTPVEYADMRKRITANLHANGFRDIEFRRTHPKGEGLLFASRDPEGPPC